MTLPHHCKDILRTLPLHFILIHFVSSFIYLFIFSPPSLGFFCLFSFCLFGLFCFVCFFWGEGGGGQLTANVLPHLDLVCSFTLVYYNDLALIEPSEIKGANLWDGRGLLSPQHVHILIFTCDSRGESEEKQKESTVISESFCISKLPFTGNRGVLPSVQPAPYGGPKCFRSRKNNPGLSSK